MEEVESSNLSRSTKSFNNLARGLYNKTAPRPHERPHRPTFRGILGGRSPPGAFHRRDNNDWVSGQATVLQHRQGELLKSHVSLRAWHRICLFLLKERSCTHAK